MQISIDQAFFMLLVGADVLLFNLFQVRLRYAFTSAADRRQQHVLMKQVLWESTHHCLSTLAGPGSHDQCRAIQPERSSLHCTH